MIIETGKLLKKPLQLEGELSLEELDLEGDQFVRLTQPAHYNLRVECVGDEILARGALNLDMECLCARCGAWFQRRQEVTGFVRSFKLATSDAAIDLTPGMREDIILSFPSNWICRPDCRGICPGCGVNLNKSVCRCQNSRGTDSGDDWSSLSELISVATRANEGQSEKTIIKEKKHGSSKT